MTAEDERLDEESIRRATEASKKALEEAAEKDPTK